MSPIVLKNQAPDGQLLQATFLPEKGMNMISYKKGGIEIIDQSTKDLFVDHFAGLGALIGPHFYRRNPATLPSIKDESLFPHIARVDPLKNRDPFSHGIGRYAPWKVQIATETKLKGVLSGKDEWNGVPLAALEGQNFKMGFEAELSLNGLKIELSVVSDADSIVGIHYYYHLPNGSGKVMSDVKNKYYDGLALKDIPETWQYDSQHILTYDLANPADYAFHPFFNPRKGQILLDAGVYRLRTTYDCSCEENSWQLYHPKDASYVCIEPVSSQNPRRANLSVSSISILLEILS